MVTVCAHIWALAIRQSLKRLGNVMENYQRLVYLYHYYDLSEDAREHAFRVYGVD